MFSLYALWEERTTELSLSLCNSNNSQIIPSTVALYPQLRSDQKSHSIPSPNCSHAQVFTVATAWCSFCLASRYLSAASRVPQANTLCRTSRLPSPQVSTVGFRGCGHDLALWLQLHTAAPTMAADNLAYLDSKSPVWKLCQTQKLKIS